MYNTDVGIFAGVCVRCTKTNDTIKSKRFEYFLTKTFIFAFFMPFFQFCLFVFVFFFSSIWRARHTLRENAVWQNLYNSCLITSNQILLLSWFLRTVVRLDYYIYKCINVLALIVIDEIFCYLCQTHVITEFEW